MAQRRIPEESGGGEVRRTAVKHYENNAVGTMNAVFPGFSVTSPRWSLNNDQTAYYRPYQAFTYLKTNASSATWDVPSSLWVGLVAVVGLFRASTFSVNGSALTPVPSFYFQPRYLDFATYGPTVTVNATTTGDIQLAPVLPETHITSGGSIVWPPALAGRSAALDI